MWSIVNNSMKLLRKPSKRGEGDGKPLKEKDQSDGKINGGVERKESARLGSGASKFLRSLRSSGGQSCKASTEQVNVIPLKELELDHERLASEFKGTDTTITLNQRQPQDKKGPERSQSFQEKRHSTGTKIFGLNKQSSKGKHSKTQSFVWNSSSKSGQNTPTSQAHNLENINTSPSTQIVHPTSNSNSRSSTPSCETIYENLEVILEQSGKHTSTSGKNKSSKSSSPESKTGVGNTLVLSSSTNSLINLEKSVKSHGKSDDCGLYGKIFHPEKDREREKRSSRNLTKDSGYETNYSDYVNVDGIINNHSSLLQSSHSMESIDDGEKPRTKEERKEIGSKGLDKLLKGISLTSISNSNCNSGKTTPTFQHQHNYSLCNNNYDPASNNASNNNNNNRKLRRSISEVPLERFPIAKFQNRLIDNSRALYSSITNGLSIWSADKSNQGKNPPNLYSVCRTPTPQLPIQQQQQQQQQKQQQQYKNYYQNPQQLYNPSSSTLPRSNYHGTEKSYFTLGSSVRNVNNVSFETPCSSYKNLSSRKIYQSQNPSLTSARSTPNLPNNSKLQQHQQQYSNLSQIYQAPLKLCKNSSSSSSALQQLNNYPTNCSGLRETVTREALLQPVHTHSNLVRIPSLEHSNENLSQISPTPSLSSTINNHNNNNNSNQWSSQDQSAAANMSNNVSGQNTAVSWAKSEPSLQNHTVACTINSSSNNSNSSLTPVRDSSSVKSVRYGPGHEKYPSWPIPVNSVSSVDPAGDHNKSTTSSGSSRSKSWTEQTDYPKEKAPSYSRPYMKRMNQSFTQQLKTVMEKCEQRDAALFADIKNRQLGGKGSLGIVPPPLGYRDMYNNNNNNSSSSSSSAGVYHPIHGKILKDGVETQIDFNIPSPPERDIIEPVKPLTQEDLEIYAKKYEEMMTQYAQSEGYHSYISSECSSYIGSGTPFLDQLRRESECAGPFWMADDANDPLSPLFGLSGHMGGPSGRESVTTVVTNSSSNSSGTETLKWHESSTASDISSSSHSSGPNSKPWEQQNIAHSAKVPFPQKSHSESVQIQNNINSGQRKNKPTLQNNSPNLKKFPLSTYARPGSLPIQHHQQQQEKKSAKLSPSESSSKTVTSPIIDTSKPPSVAERIHELEQQKNNPINKESTANLTELKNKENQKMNQTQNIQQNGYTNSNNSNNDSSTSNKMPNTDSITNLTAKSITQSGIREKAQPQQPSNTATTTTNTNNPSFSEHLQNNNGPSEKGPILPNSPVIEDNKGLLNGLAAEIHQNHYNHQQKQQQQQQQKQHESQISPTTNNANNIHNISYTYLDPKKRHKVADMTLKAIQKKALLSYYERHIGKTVTAGEASTQVTNNNNSNTVRGNNQSNSNSNGTSCGGGGKNDVQQSVGHLDIDLPLSSIRLALSLPRDIDRIKESQNNQGRRVSMDENATSTKINTTSNDSPTSRSIGASNSSPNKSGRMPSNPSENIDKGENVRIDQSFEELTQSLTMVGESARMAYMSKYLPHLVTNGEGSWAESSSPGGAPVPSATTMMANSNNPSTATEPIPPERPPKKPHLRNVCQQVNEGNKDRLSPPPPLPRAPIRQNSSNLNNNNNGQNLPPPVPVKPGFSVRTPELPPPPAIIGEESELSELSELPPPPTLTDLDGSRSGSLSGMSSYLHKDSYLAQRKERSLGYEGRYRRTLSPSGMGSKSVEGSQMSNNSTNDTNNPTGQQIDSTLNSPSAWEKYHNIRAPGTTVIFTSQEIAKPPLPPPSQPLFHRSMSCDSNIFGSNNSNISNHHHTNHHSTINGHNQTSSQHQPPPVAQVAPLRGHSDQSNRRSSIDKGSLENEKSCKKMPSPPLTPKIESYNSINGKSSKLTSNAETSTSPSPPVQIMPSLKVFPIRNGHSETNLDNVGEYPITIMKRSSTDHHGLLNGTSDASSQTDLLRSSGGVGSGVGNKRNIGPRNGYEGPTRSLSLSSSSASSSSSSVSASSSASFSDGHESPINTNNTNGNGNHAKETSFVSTSSMSMSLSTSSTSSSPVNNAAILYKSRQKSQEEIECEEFSRNLAKHLPRGDKLQALLVPLPKQKTTADYIEGLLFPLELNLKSAEDSQEQIVNGGGGKFGHRSPSLSPQESRIASQEPSKPDYNKRTNGHAPLPADSAYFTTSESKAKFLTQYVNNMNNDSISKKTDGQELDKQKEELVNRISRKLDILRTEQHEIREEIESNEQLGQNVVQRVRETAKRNEFDKFKLHVEEIEKITSLLLGLSGRLARAENALMALSQENSNPQEKKILESKRDKLKEQLDEAKILKENIDRRSAQVSGFLQKYLAEEEFADYLHFVKMKAKLIIDSREIDDKIKLGEEQNVALQETLRSSSTSSQPDISSTT